LGERFGLWVENIFTIKSGIPFFEKGMEFFLKKLKFDNLRE